MSDKNNWIDLRFVSTATGFRRLNDKVKVVAGGGDDVIFGTQFGDDPHMVCLLTHRSFQERAHAKFLADGPALFILALETERRAAADNLEVVDLGKGSEQFLREAIRKILVPGIAAFVQERQHRDGFFRDR